MTDGFARSNDVWPHLRTCVRHMSNVQYRPNIRRICRLRQIRQANATDRPPVDLAVASAWLSQSAATERPGELHSLLLAPLVPRRLSETLLHFHADQIGCHPVSIT